MKEAILAILILACCTVAHASEESHRAAVEKMLEATNVEKNLGNVYTQLSGNIDEQFKQMDVPEKMVPILIKYKNKQLEVTKEELSWQKIKDDIIKSYMKVYSEEEVIEITKFFNSPIGVKYVSKLPELTQEMMKGIQSRVPALVEKYRQIREDMAQDMKTAEELDPKSP